MNCKNRLKLIKSISDVFSIKKGNIFKCQTNKKCYRTSKWFSFIFHIWHGEMAIIAMIIWAFTLNHFTFLEGVLTPSLASIATFILLEFLLICIMPLEEIACWKINMEKQRLKSKKIIKNAKKS